MKFKTNIIGLERILKRLGNMPKEADAELTKALTICAFRVQRTAARSIQNSPADPKTGRSKPGNPPKTDTGRLVGSIFVTSGNNGNQPFVIVGTNVAYGRHLEFGTQDIAARPWLGPAMLANYNANVKTLKEAIKAVVKRHG